MLVSFITLVLKKKKKPKTSFSKKPDDEEDEEIAKLIPHPKINFAALLETKQFSKIEEVLLVKHPSEVTPQYLAVHGFSRPILFPSTEGLEMTLPDKSFTVSDVLTFVGASKKVDAIDVSTQQSESMSLGDWVKYYTGNPAERKQILNVISLEFSKTKLAKKVQSPKVVREIDWIEIAWPKEQKDQRPQVQLYCLMGVSNSYTDFHIDFGGTSVWYHVFRGEKIFYFIPPTPQNLQLYEKWSSSAQQHETFLGDFVSNCYKCVLKEGQTLLIPTGTQFY